MKLIIPNEPISEALINILQNDIRNNYNEIKIERIKKNPKYLRILIAFAKYKNEFMKQITCEINLKNKEMVIDE